MIYSIIFLLDLYGFIALDQIRTIAKERCIKKLGTIDEVEAKLTLRTLQKMFADI